jgi:hypothetical protein
MTPAHCYRVQPRGLALAHTSDDWAGDRMTPGHLCAYPSPEALLSGEGDDWVQRRGLEVVEFEGEVIAQLGGAHVPGVEVVPVGPVIRRTPLARWLRTAGKGKS